MTPKQKNLRTRIDELASQADIENRPFTSAAGAFLNAGDEVRGFRFFIEEGNAAEKVNRAGGGASHKGQETAEREARRIVRKVGVADVFQYSEAYEFVRDKGRVDGYDYVTDPPTDIFRVVTDYAEVLVLRDVLMDADARAEAAEKKAGKASA